MNYTLTLLNVSQFSCLNIRRLTSFMQFRTLISRVLDSIILDYSVGDLTSKRVHSKRATLILTCTESMKI